MAVRAFPLPTNSAVCGPEDAANVGIDCRYFGHSEIRETTGFAVVVRIREGGVAGTILATASLGANGAIPAFDMSPAGVAVRGGLYLQVVSGTGIIEGSVFAG